MAFDIYDGIQSTAHVTRPESAWRKAKNWMSQNDYSDGHVLSPDLEDSSIMKEKEDKNKTQMFTKWSLSKQSKHFTASL